MGSCRLLPEGIEQFVELLIGELGEELGHQVKVNRDGSIPEEICLLDELLEHGLGIW